MSGLVRITIKFRFSNPAAHEPLPVHDDRRDSCGSKIQPACSALLSPHRLSQYPTLLPDGYQLTADRNRDPPSFLCAEYERQLGGGSPLSSLMTAKGRGAAARLPPIPIFACTGD